MNTISHRFRKCEGVDNNGTNSSKAVERRSCWAIVTIDRLEIDAKIMHKGRGKFEILEDNCKGRYISKIVDASDVLRCKVEDDNALNLKPPVRECPRCNLVNTFESKYCSKCSYPLTPQAYEEIKANEELKLRVIEEKHKQDIEAMREEMNQQFNQIISMGSTASKIIHIGFGRFAAKQIS